MIKRNIIILIGISLLLVIALVSAKDSKLAVIEDRPLFGNEVFEIGDEKTYLYDIEQGISYGIARRAYASGTYIQIVSADIVRTEEAKYKVWLVNPQTSEKLDAGWLASVDGEYLSVYQSDRDLRQFSKIIVGQTLESPLLLGAF